MVITFHQILVLMKLAPLPKLALLLLGGPYDNPHHSWSFKTTLEGYAQMIEDAGSDKKLCVTEFGWASSEGYPESPAGFGFAEDITLEEQAEYIVQAFNQMHDSGDVSVGVFVQF